MFNDRNDAAIKLAEQLKHYQGQHPLILAIPRGAVPMAKIIAQKLGGDIDVVLVRKLRAPFNDELAIGSVDESGWTYLNEIATSFGANTQMIEDEKQSQMALIKQRRAHYTPIHPPLKVTGRIVIVVDDGMATGATMMAALHGLRHKHAAKIICAVPVAPPQTLKKMAQLADEVICIEAHENFQAVGQFYRNFPQVEDDEVTRILKETAT